MGHFSEDPRQLQFFDEEAARWIDQPDAAPAPPLSLRVDGNWQPAAAPLLTTVDQFADEQTVAFPAPFPLRQASDSSWLTFLQQGDLDFADKQPSASPYPWLSLNSASIANNTNNNNNNNGIDFDSAGELTPSSSSSSATFSTPLAMHRLSSVDTNSVGAASNLGTGNVFSHSPSLRSVASDLSDTFDADMDYALPRSAASVLTESSPSSAASASASAASVPASASSAATPSAGSGWARPRLKRKISALRSLDYFATDPLNFTADADMAELEAELFKTPDSSVIEQDWSNSSFQYQPFAGGLDFDQVELRDENLAALPYLPAKRRRYNSGHPAKSASASSSSSFAPGATNFAALALLPSVAPSAPAAGKHEAGKPVLAPASASLAAPSTVAPTPSASSARQPASKAAALRREALLRAQQLPVVRTPFASVQDSLNVPAALLTPAAVAGVDPSVDPDSVVEVGVYTRAQRKEIVAKHKAKSKAASVKRHAKVVQCPGRKLFAESRPRVGGRFVKLPAGFHEKFRKEIA